MIVDTLENLSLYTALHPHISKVLDFLSSSELEKLPDGKYEIDGKDIYASVMSGDGKLPEQAKLEIHNRYIDIQLLLTGIETLGWKPRAHCTEPIEEYDSEKDIQFFKDSPDNWVTLHPHQFVIFFPSDAHAPMVSSNFLKKIVLKLRQ